MAQVYSRSQPLWPETPNEALLEAYPNRYDRGVPVQNQEPDDSYDRPPATVTARPIHAVTLSKDGPRTLSDEDRKRFVENPRSAIGTTFGTVSNEGKLGANFRVHGVFETVTGEEVYLVFGGSEGLAHTLPRFGSLLKEQTAYQAPA